MAAVPVTRPDIEDVLGTAEVARILGVHPRTVERRRTAARKPGPLQAQRIEKLHRIWKQLLAIYTPENASRWLHSSVPALGDRLPLDIMKEDGGLDRVLDIVVRMSWGIPA
jgi:putative toxin-antitoxin system antitoxin component (TIGR02293 family)